MKCSICDKECDKLESHVLDNDIQLDDFADLLAIITSDDCADKGAKYAIDNFVCCRDCYEHLED